MSERPIKHFTSSAYVFTDESPRRVLLINHRKLGKWLPPGGHVDEGENPLEAAVREVREETGLDISNSIGRPQTHSDATALPLPKHFLEELIPASQKEPQHYHLDLIYSVNVPHQAVSHREKESHGIGWFTLEEIGPLPMFESTRTILEQELL